MAKMTNDDDTDGTTSGDAVTRARATAAAAERAAELADRAADAAEAAAAAEAEAKAAQDESDRLSQNDSPASEVAAEPASESGAEPVAVTTVGTRRTWPMRVTAGALVLVTVVAVAASVLLIQSSRDATSEATRDATAIATARQGVVDLLSVDTSDIDGYTQKILDQTTGELHDTFADSQSSPLVSTEVQQTATGEVIEAGVERSDSDGTTSVLVWAKAVNPAITGTDANTLPLLLRVNVVPVGDGQLKLSKVELAQ